MRVSGVRLRTYLRRRRLEGAVSLVEACALTGLARGEVVAFERGLAVPGDGQLDAMRAVYGAPGGWYPPSVLRVLLPDLGDCLGCGDELDPDASAAQTYHSDECRDADRAATRPSPSTVT